MRIIGGEFRGRKLTPIGRGSHIRPTSDRIRESVFSIIGNHIQDANVLDLFAGTGALGLEALSRGAASAVFVDRDRRALSLVSQNAHILGLDRRTRIIGWDIAKDLNCIRPPEADHSDAASDGAMKPVSSGFGLVFADPPYNQNLVRTTLAHLAHSDALLPDAIVVVEHSPSEPILDDLTGYRMDDQRKYGRTCVSFLKTN